jgi:bifunctional DNase/RNase
MQIRVDLAKIIITETVDQQIIILKERDGERSFPIVIGIAEAFAIDRRLKGIRTPRPLTHELLATVVEQLGGQLEKIIINDLREHTFYSQLIIRQNGRLIEVDSRPSDAIALGVASDVPIYVEEHVLQDVSQ